MTWDVWWWVNQTTLSTECKAGNTCLNKYLDHKVNFETRSQPRVKTFNWGISPGFSAVCPHLEFRLLSQIGFVCKSSVTETRAHWKLFGFSSLSWIINTVWKGGLHKAMGLQIKHSVFILSTAKENTPTYCGCVGYEQMKKWLYKPEGRN